MTTEKTVEEAAVDALLAAAGEKAAAGVIHKADSKYPADMTFEAAHGYVVIYDTKTGDSSMVNRNLLLHYLRKKRDDGTRVFWIEPPANLPEKPKGLNCMLHPEDPKRPEYDLLGLPVCPRLNLANRYQVILHMRKRHKISWETIQDEENRKEEQEEKRQRELDRQLQREMLRKVTKEK